jgi:hypothetical protein
MAKAAAAYMNVTWRGLIAEGDEVFHDLVLYTNVRYNIDLVAEDPAVDLNLYITDNHGDTIYRDESREAGASAWFQPGEDGIYSFFVKSEIGSAAYELRVREETAASRAEEVIE